METRNSMLGLDHTHNSYKSSFEEGGWEGSESLVIIKAVAKTGPSMKAKESCFLLYVARTALTLSSGCLLLDGSPCTMGERLGSRSSPARILRSREGR